MGTEATALGGWTEWNFTPGHQDIAAFKEATQGYVGVGYTLVASASQVVNGTNYAFLCEARSVTLNQRVYLVVINAFQPIGGKPTITDIKKVGPFPNPMPGGWTNWNFHPSPEAVKFFDTASNGNLGVGYSPVAYTSQLVAGVNYCFLAKGTVVVPNQPHFAALVYIYQPLPNEGEAHVTGIKKILPY
jgi:hypothetical protein